MANENDTNAFTTNLAAMLKQIQEATKPKPVSKTQGIGTAIGELGRGFLLAGGGPDPGSPVERLQKQQLAERQSALQETGLAAQFQQLIEQTSQRQFQNNLGIATLAKELAQLGDPEVAAGILQNFSTRMGSKVADAGHLINIFKQNAKSIDTAFETLSKGFDPKNPQHRRAVNQISKAIQDKDVRGQVMAELGVIPKEPANDFERTGFGLFGKVGGYSKEEAQEIRQTLKQEKIDVVRQTGAEAAARQPLPAETAKELGALETLSNEIGKIERLFKPEFVGPITGRTAGVIEATTGDLPAEQIEMRAALRDAQDALLRARSGAQINEQEFKRMMSFLPNDNLPPNVFKVRLKRFKDVTKTLIEQKRKASGITRGELKSPTEKADFVFDPATKTLKRAQ